jgi:hypothetical protein
MDITATIDVPCIEIKPLGDLPSIPLPGGAQINPFIELGGPQPSDCKLSFNLLLQLGPLFASMGCLLKILNVLGKIVEFAQAVPGVVTKPQKLAQTIGELVPAINDALKCFPPLAILDFLEMIKQIILLILSYLACFLEQVDSILKFKATLDFGSAEGNPALTDALNCAAASADASMGNLMKSLGPIQPILKIVGMVAGMAGQSLTLPDFSSISISAEGSSIEQTVASIKSAVDGLRGVVASLP